MRKKSTTSVHNLNFFVTELFLDELHAMSTVRSTNYYKHEISRTLM